MIKAFFSGILFLFLPTIAPAQRPDHAAQIAPILRQTQIVQVSCGDDADIQTCKFFVHAVNVDLRAERVTALLYYDPEVMVQSFYVPPRLYPGLHVTLRLIEQESAQGLTLFLGGTCFDPSGRDLDGIKLPRWSTPEGGQDTGPMESDKAAAASKLAREFAAYWKKLAG